MPENELSASWLTGRIANVALITPVRTARVELADEPSARRLRARLEEVFELWKNSHGASPTATYGKGLLGSPFAGKPISECPAYVCAGDGIHDYADLMNRLLRDRFPPLAEFIKAAGIKPVLASLVMAEAAAVEVDSAIKAGLHLENIVATERYEFQRQFQQSQAPLYELAKEAAASRTGYRSRTDQIDKRDFQRLVDSLFKRCDFNIEETKRQALDTPALAPYIRKYPRAIRNWLAEIRPEGKIQKGRPKKRKPDATR